MDVGAPEVGLASARRLSASTATPEIAIADPIIEDLGRRLAVTRLPPDDGVDDWTDKTNAAYLRDLIASAAANRRFRLDPGRIGSDSRPRPRERQSDPRAGRELGVRLPLVLVEGACVTLIAEKQKTRYDPFMRTSDEAQADRRRRRRHAAFCAERGGMMKKNHAGSRVTY
jgi:hypothetical protein